MHRMTPLGVVFSLGLLLAPGAQAASGKDTDVKLDASLPVAAQISAIEKAISSEDYSEISKDDKVALQQALDRIQTRLGDHEQVEQLDPQDRQAVLKDQGEVNTLLAQARADSRVTCRRERLTGSNMPQRVCMTAAQRRKAEENSRRMLDDSQRNGGNRS